MAFVFFGLISLSRVGKEEEMREPSCTGGRNANWCTTMENNMEAPQRIKNGTSYDPEIPLLGIYPKKPKTNLKEYMQPYVHCSIIYKSQNLEATQVLINKQVDKKVVICIYTHTNISHIYIHIIYMHINIYHIHTCL